VRSGEAVTNKSNPVLMLVLVYFPNEHSDPLGEVARYEETKKE
jgi:hypothetical protein